MPVVVQPLVVFEFVAGGAEYLQVFYFVFASVTEFVDMVEGQRFVSSEVFFFASAEEAPFLVLIVVIEYFGYRDVR